MLAIGCYLSTGLLVFAVLYNFYYKKTRPIFNNDLAIIMTVFAVAWPFIIFVFISSTIEAWDKSD
jgi:O-antigen/teichoic acid export membrane protein